MGAFAGNLNRIFRDLYVENPILGLAQSATDFSYSPMN